MTSKYYPFGELCRELGITMQDGMKMFIHGNIYINKEYTFNTPFIGHGLHKPPYCVKAKAITPENITVGLHAKLEIIKRLKLADPKLHCYLKDRYEQVKLVKRNRLAAYNGTTDKFRGTVQRGRIDGRNGTVVRLVLENLAFSMIPNDVIAAYCQVTVPLSKFLKLKLEPGDTIEFIGSVKTYMRYDPATNCTVKDYSVACVFDKEISKIA